MTVMPISHIYVPVYNIKMAPYRLKISFLKLMLAYHSFITYKCISSSYILVRIKLCGNFVVTYPHILYFK